jgi:hypothetical protein
MLLFQRFSAKASPNCDAMALMKQWNEQDPRWLPRYIKAEVKARGWRLLPLSWWTRRWSRLRGLPLHRKVLRLPIAAVAAIVDTLIFVAAIRDVHGGRAYRYWVVGEPAE